MSWNDAAPDMPAEIRELGDEFEREGYRFEDETPERAPKTLRVFRTTTHVGEVMLMGVGQRWDVLMRPFGASWFGNLSAWDGADRARTGQPPRRANLRHSIAWIREVHAQETPHDIDIDAFDAAANTRLRSARVLRMLTPLLVLAVVLMIVAVWTKSWISIAGALLVLAVSGAAYRRFVTQTRS